MRTAVARSPHPGRPRERRADPGEVPRSRQHVRNRGAGDPGAGWGSGQTMWPFLQWGPAQPLRKGILSHATASVTLEDIVAVKLPGVRGQMPKGPAYGASWSSQVEEKRNLAPRGRGGGNGGWGSVSTEFQLCQGNVLGTVLAQRRSAASPSRAQRWLRWQAHVVAVSTINSLD